MNMFLSSSTPQTQHNQLADYYSSVWVVYIEKEILRNEKILEQWEKHILYMKVSLEDYQFYFMLFTKRLADPSMFWRLLIWSINKSNQGTELWNPNVHEWMMSTVSGMPGHSAKRTKHKKNMVQVGWAYYHSLKKTYLQTHNKLKRMLTLLICFPGRGSERENILCFLRSILPLTFLKGLRGQISCRSSSPSFHSSSSWAASWLFVSTVDESTKIWPRIETRCVWRWTVSCLI